MVKKRSALFLLVPVLFAFFSTEIHAYKITGINEDQDKSRFASGISDEALWGFFWDFDYASQEFSPFVALPDYWENYLSVPIHPTQERRLPEGVPETITENGIVYELYAFSSSTGYLFKLMTKEAYSALFDGTTLGGKPFAYLIERNGQIYRIKGMKPIWVKGKGPTSYFSAFDRELERIEDTKDKIVFTVTISAREGSGLEPLSVQYPITLIREDPTAYLDTRQWKVSDCQVSSLAIYDRYLTEHHLSPFDISPATGDSAVFLLPAAALSLCGILLAAKRRKRRGMTGADR